MNEFRKSSQIRLFVLITVIAAAFDQLSKRWALAKLGEHEPVPLIPGVLEFLRIENRGAAFGILQGKMVFFYLITAVVAAGILYVIIKLPERKKYCPLLVTLAFLLAGAVGNLIDRAFRQSVVDFIYFKPIDFPVFNVADIYVTCATFFMVVLVLRFYEDEDFAFLSRKKGSSPEDGRQEAGPREAGPQNAGAQNAGAQDAGPQNAGAARQKEDSEE